MTNPIPPAPRRTAMAAVAAVDLVKVYGSGDTAVRALDGVTVGFARAAVHRDHGPVRLRQVHADALPGRPGHGHLRAGAARRHRPDRAARPGAHQGPPGADRLRLPVVQPAAAAHRRAEHHAAAGPGRPAGPTGDLFDAPGRRARPRRPARATGPASCPAASSSGSRWPGRWCPGPRWSSPTSRPATWTPAPAPRCCRSCATRSASWARPSSWSPTTRSRPRTPTGSCCSPTAGWPARSTGRTSASVTEALQRAGGRPMSDGAAYPAAAAWPGARPGCCSPAWPSWSRRSSSSRPCWPSRSPSAACWTASAARPAAVDLVVASGAVDHRSELRRDRGAARRGRGGRPGRRGRRDRRRVPQPHRRPGHRPAGA